LGKEKLGDGFGEVGRVRERTRHLMIGDRVREDLGQVQKDAASLVQDLDAGFDLEIFSDGVI